MVSDDYSIWLDFETFTNLTKIARKNNRTKIGQIRHWVKQNGK